MNKSTETFGLRCPDGREAQLLSVQVKGEILGLMLRLTVRQVWRNASGAPMATRLSFPLDWDQTLLDLQLQRPQGSQTLDKVWRESRHTCSATPGVLATGEQVTLQWRIGQLLSLQGSSLRLQLPAGLIPRAARPAQISLEVHDPVAQGTVSCPSHNLHKVRHVNSMSLSLHAAAGLDKDLVLTVHGLRDTVFALASPDASAPGHCTVLMSASPRLPAASTPSRALRMKLLVDSSSTMPVERLSQIRGALDKLLAQMQAEDQLSYSRFGERTVHDLPRLQVCTEAYQRRVRALARHTDTNLGQPDPLAALQATLAIPDEEEQAVGQADILLITASPLWAVEPAFHALSVAGHRLHVMAVGDAADSLWRELAEASGGGFEALGPGQHSLQVLTRLIERLRQQHAVQARLALENTQPLGAAERRSEMTDGDTLHLWAKVRSGDNPQDLAGRPELRPALVLQHGQDSPQSLTAPTVLWDEEGDLTRVCAMRDLLQLDETQRQQHIECHALTVPNDSKLAAQMATPKPAPVSAAASVPPPHTAEVAQPTPAPAAVTAAANVLPVRALRGTAPRHTDLAGWLTEPAAPGNPLTALVASFNAQASGYSQFRAALSGTLQRSSTPLLNGIVLQLARKAGNPGRVWAMLLHWLDAEHEIPLNTQARQLLAQELATVPVTLRNEINTALGAAAVPAVTRQAA